jgi:hypothetical protein
MLTALVPDRAAVAEEAASQTPIITTLYDLIAALHGAGEPGEEDLVTAAVADLCHTGHLRFLACPNTPVVVCRHTARASASRQTLRYSIPCTGGGSPQGQNRR